MNESSGLIGPVVGVFAGVAALAAAAAGWAWQRQRRQTDALRERLAAAEHSRLDFQARMLEADERAAQTAAAVAASRPVAPVPAPDAATALLSHLGDTGADRQDAGGRTDADWADTEPVTIQPPPETDTDVAYPAFAETQPIGLGEEPTR